MFSWKSAVADVAAGPLDSVTDAPLGSSEFASGSKVHFDAGFALPPPWATLAKAPPLGRDRIAKVAPKPPAPKPGRLTGYETSSSCTISPSPAQTSTEFPDAVSRSVATRDLITHLRPRPNPPSPPKTPPASPPPAGPRVCFRPPRAARSG